MNERLVSGDDELLREVDTFFAASLNSGPTAKCSNFSCFRRSQKRANHLEYYFHPFLLE